MQRQVNPFSLYSCCSFLARLLFRLFCRIHLVVLETPPQEGCCIIASNHISHFEPVLLGGFFPRPLDWVAMKELFHARWSNWFLSQLHAVSVDRLGKDSATTRRTFQTILERLSQGRAIGIFPEGGIRSHHASILEGAPMKPGLITISLLSQAPIIPCVVLGTDRLYVGRNWLCRPSIWIIIGQAIMPPTSHGTDTKKARHDFQQQISAAFPRLQQELVHRFQLIEDDLPQTAQERQKAATR